MVVFLAGFPLSVSLLGPATALSQVYPFKPVTLDNRVGGTGVIDAVAAARAALRIVSWLSLFVDDRMDGVWRIQSELEKAAR